ncbi:hypothetical protein CCMSSC00406_0009913 [Pleurotus cornucopiae]|uniref:Uncharacterized protein n=1 Tax=Pleurotus cornucopiae TaxID=5321 RepID=A0ACB7ITD5_PLECO|nr:hypothetical protein CCMSSC00406_0009913 [Pleurotus cornucopiae]
MSSETSTSETSTSAPDYELRARTLLRSRHPLHTNPPDNAYGVYLTNECLLRFGYMMRESQGYPPSTDSEAEARDAKNLAASELPLLVQIVVPGLTLTRWRPVLVRPFGPLGIRRLLVLADDNSQENMKMRNTPEVEQELVEFLGLEDQKPAWYAVVKWCVCPLFNSSNH